MYLSIEQARTELARRRNDEDLCLAALELMGGELPPVPDAFWQSPLPACYFRQMARARKEDLEFVRQAQMAGLTPWWGTYLNDRFITNNGDKLTCVRIRMSNQPKIDLARDPFHVLGKEKPRLGEIMTPFLLPGKEEVASLHEVHVAARRLVMDQVAGNFFDVSSWYRHLCQPQLERVCPVEYYPGMMAFFAVHAILFEDFHGGPNASSGLGDFRERVVQPAIEKVQCKLGVEPLIVHYQVEAEMLEYPAEVLDFLRNLQKAT